MKTKIINYLFLLTNQAGIAFMAFSALGFKINRPFDANGILFLFGLFLIWISIMIYHVVTIPLKLALSKKIEIILFSSYFEVMLSLLPTGIMAIQRNDIPFGVTLTAVCIISMVIFLPYDILVKQAVMK